MVSRLSPSLLASIQAPLKMRPGIEATSLGLAYFDLTLTLTSPQADFSPWNRTMSRNNWPWVFFDSRHAAYNRGYIKWTK